MSQQATRERYFGGPKISFLVQKRSCLLKRTRISNTRDTDFHLFITLGDESAGLGYALCTGKIISFHSERLSNHMFK